MTSVTYGKYTKAFSHPVKTAKLIRRRYLSSLHRSRDPETRYMQSWMYGQLPRRPAADVFPGIELSSVQVINPFNLTHNMSVSLSELCHIVSIAQAIQASRILEIGTFDGRTTLNLAANVAEGGKVYTVDYPEGYGEVSTETSSFYNNRIDSQVVGRQFAGSGYEDKIELILHDSATLDYTQFGVLDLVFIDGCHDKSYVRLDFENALRHTRPGGVILWHDYGMIEDVSTVVDELSQDLEICCLQGTRLAAHIVGSDMR